VTCKEPNSNSGEVERRPEYPAELKDREDAAVETRHRELQRGEGVPAPFSKVFSRLVEDAPCHGGAGNMRPRVGFALSGGGIRSATFSLGIFQSLARAGGLRAVDYLSTVSGGGYFGAFLGRLFTHGEEDLGKALDPPRTVNSAPTDRVKRVEEILGDCRSKPVHWLRENGRYLAPNGAGDLIAGATAVLRNWVAVHVVLGTFILMVFLFVNVVRFGVEATGLRCPFASQCIWWSPILLLPLLTFVLAVLLGGAYYATFLSIFSQDRTTLYERRRWLTTRLGELLVATLVGLLYALVDTFGETLYAHFRQREFWASVASLVALGAAGVTVGNKIAGIFGEQGRRRLVRVPLKLLAGLASLVLVSAVLVLLNAVSHGFAWGWVNLAPDSEEAAQVSWGWLGGGLLAAFVLSRFVFGSGWAFLNYSSQQPLYNARLTRAYLGASNPARWTGEHKSVVQPEKGDAIEMADYDPHTKGGPLHLINLTINETIDGRSMIQQQDRKGVGMAVGPCGISIGVRHHATWCNGRRNLLPPAYKEKAFQVFADPNQAGASGVRGTIAPEALDLGTWTAVSGAAFSTGLGSRTSLAVSLLCGLFNVRLGYWWQSGVDPRNRSAQVKRTFAKRIGAVVNRLFPVPMYLLDEFTARFHGTARRRWYLSDGGHFENMGAYELVRRRLPLIVICDGEQDRTYTFGGLANLVRKARTDFAAEIRFLEADELKQYVSNGKPWELAMGTLDDLKSKSGSDSKYSLLREPGWSRPCGLAKSEYLESDPAGDARKCSKAHAALARVFYDGSDVPGSWILYIKATVTGDEPTDVIEYADDHPDFPHETTVDQFFDEAQWESYRMLGEHIGEKLFGQPGSPSAPRGAGPGVRG